MEKQRGVSANRHRKVRKNPQENDKDRSRWCHLSIFMELGKIQTKRAKPVETEIKPK